MAKVVADTILGFCKVELKLLGPDQAKLLEGMNPGAALPELKLKVVPAQMGELLLAVAIGAAGSVKILLVASLAVQPVLVREKFV